MPEISLFYGIRVTMYYNDHMPPHFHAEYNGHKALVDINNIQVIRGSLPNKQLRLILAWCTIHQDEYFPTVVQVIPLDNYHVQVFFDDGKIVDYDTTQDLKSSIFEPLRDIENFKNACTVMNGTLAWDISGKMDESNCIDIDPFTLYELKAINSLIA